MIGHEIRSDWDSGNAFVEKGPYDLVSYNLGSMLCDPLLVSHCLSCLSALRLRDRMTLLQRRYPSPNRTVTRSALIGDLVTPLLKKFHAISQVLRRRDTQTLALRDITGHGTMAGVCVRVRVRACHRRGLA